MVLVASVHAGAGDGGLVLVGADACETIDHLPTHGVAVSPEGDRVARLVRAGEDHHEPTSLLISDRAGVLLLRRVPVVDPHSLLWTQAGIIAVSTGTNSILWFDDTGAVLREWSPGGVGDCWHLNTLGLLGGRLVSSAFGRFAETLQWKRDGTAGHGIVYDVEAGAVVLDGLSAPHEALRVDDRWFVCNSGTGSLLTVEPDGTRRSLPLRGWARGMARQGRSLFVGVTPLRDSGEHAARVATIDLDHFAEVSSVTLPGSNVFALVELDEALLEGIRLGARLTSSMASPSVAVQGPLDERDCVAELRLVEARRDRSDETVVTAIVVNRGRRSFASVGSHPVYIGVRQRDDGGGFADVHRVHLPLPVGAGRSQELTFVLPELPLPGAPVNLCLLQEGVRWFDSVSPAAACDLHV